MNNLCKNTIAVNSYGALANGKKHQVFGVGSFANGRGARAVIFGQLFQCQRPRILRTKVARCTLRSIGLPMESSTGNCHFANGKGWGGEAIIVEINYTKHYYNW